MHAGPVVMRLGIVELRPKSPGRALRLMDATRPAEAPVSARHSDSPRRSDESAAILGGQ